MSSWRAAQLRRHRERDHAGRGRGVLAPRRRLLGLVVGPLLHCAVDAPPGWHSSRRSSKYHRERPGAIATFPPTRSQMLSLLPLCSSFSPWRVSRGAAAHPSWCRRSPRPRRSSTSRPPGSRSSAARGAQEQGGDLEAGDGGGGRSTLRSRTRRSSCSSAFRPGWRSSPRAGLHHRGRAGGDAGRAGGDAGRAGGDGRPPPLRPSGGGARGRPGARGGGRGLAEPLVQLADPDAAVAAVAEVAGVATGFPRWRRRLRFHAVPSDSSDRRGPLFRVLAAQRRAAGRGRGVDGDADVEPRGGAKAESTAGEGSATPTRSSSPASPTSRRT